MHILNACTHKVSLIPTSLPVGSLPLAHNAEHFTSKEVVHKIRGENDRRENGSSLWKNIVAQIRKIVVVKTVRRCGKNIVALQNRRREERSSHGKRLVTRKNRRHPVKIRFDTNGAP